MDLENRSKRKRSLESRISRRSSSPGRNEPSLHSIHRLFNVYLSFEEAVENDQPLQDHWFQSVLDAGKSDNLQQKRLSVRLILSMLPKYSQFSEDCFSPLIHFSTYHPSTRYRREDSLSHKLRVDAIRAFEPLWKNAPQLMSKITRHLLAAVNDQHKSLYGNRIPTGSIAERSPSEVEYKTLLFSLETAFSQNPKCVLEECFRITELMDRSFIIGLEVFYQRVLLNQALNKPTLLIQNILQPIGELTQWCGKSIRTLLMEPGLRSAPESLHRCLMRLRDAVWELLDTKSDNQSWSRKPRSGREHHHSSTGGGGARGAPVSSSFRLSSKFPGPSSRTSTMRLTMSQEEVGPFVWFASLPSPMTKDNLVDICSRYGSVQMIIYPPASPEKALVVFQSSKEAYHCSQEVQLCHPSRLFCMNVINVKKCKQMDCQTSTFLWVDCNVSQEEYQSKIITCLKSAQLPLPRHILKFLNKPEGLLLELQTLGIMNQTLSVLHRFLNKEPPVLPPANPVVEETKTSPVIDSDTASSEDKFPHQPTVLESSKDQESKTWRGRLRVKGKLIGMMECQEGMEKCPAELDIKFTQKLHNVLGRYIGLPPSKRHITPLRSEDHNAFEKLKRYLLKRNVAGVIRLKQSRFYVIPSCSSIRRFVRMNDNNEVLLFCVRIDEI
eukprot:g1460.t1